MSITLGDVVPADIPAFPALLAQLGYPADEEAIPARIQKISWGGGRVIVARDEERVAGFLTLAFLPQIHHDDPLCRITALVVDEAARGARPACRARSSSSSAGGCLSIASLAGRAPPR